MATWVLAWLLASALGKDVPVPEDVPTMKVRITGPHPSYRVDAVRFDATGVVLADASVVRWEEVGLAWEGRPRSRVAGAGRGALVGMAAGGLTGGAVGFVIPRREDCRLDCVSGPLAAMVLGGFGSLVGIVPGALVGAVAPGREWWLVRPSRYGYRPP